MSHHNHQSHVINLEAAPNPFEETYDPDVLENSSSESQYTEKNQFTENSIPKRPRQIQVKAGNNSSQSTPTSSINASSSGISNFLKKKKTDSSNRQATQASSFDLDKANKRFNLLEQRDKARGCNSTA